MTIFGLGFAESTRSAGSQYPCCGTWFEDGVEGPPLAVELVTDSADGAAVTVPLLRSVVLMKLMLMTISGLGTCDCGTVMGLRLSTS
jgi:hypothetical protein